MAFLEQNEKIINDEMENYLKENIKRIVPSIMKTGTSVDSDEKGVFAKENSKTQDLLDL